MRINLQIDFTGVNAIDYAEVISAVPVIRNGDDRIQAGQNA
jgi:hypothetical protein